MYTPPPHWLESTQKLIRLRKNIFRGPASTMRFNKYFPNEKKNTFLYTTQPSSSDPPIFGSTPQRQLSEWITAASSHSVLFPLRREIIQSTFLLEDTSI